MKRNLRNLAYEALKKKITFLEFKPGDRLFDTEIAAELGISRTPVREALLALEREQLVDCTGNNGYLVHKLTLEEADDHFAIRELLEAYAVKLIAERVTPQILDDLRAKMADAERCIAAKDTAGVIRCNTEFHGILYRATASDVFVRMMSLVSDKLRWLSAISLSVSNGFQDALEDHKRIVKALEESDATGLEAAFRAHLDHAREKYLSVRNIFF